MSPLLAAATLAPTAANAASDWNAQEPGVLLEIGLALAGLAVLLVMAFPARERWTRQTAPAWPGSTDDTLMDMVAIIAPFLATFGLVGILLRGIVRFAHVSDSTTLLMLSVLVAEASFLAVIIGYHFLRRRLNLNSTSLLTAKWGPAVFLAAWPIVLGLIFLWQLLLDKCGYPPTNQALVDQFRDLSTWSSRGAFIVFACVLAPITEEIVFRGILYRGFKRLMPRWAAALLSAVLFGGAHLDLTSVVPLIALGFLFALAYDATGCIAVTIVAHGLFNLNTIVALLLGFGS